MTFDVHAKSRVENSLNLTRFLKILQWHIEPSYLLFPCSSLVCHLLPAQSPIWTSAPEAAVHALLQNPALLPAGNIAIIIAINAQGLARFQLGTYRSWAGS